MTDKEIVLSVISDSIPENIKALNPDIDFGEYSFAKEVLETSYGLDAELHEYLSESRLKGLPIKKTELVDPFQETPGGFKEDSYTYTEVVKVETNDGAVFFLGFINEDSGDGDWFTKEVFPKTIYV